MIKSPIQLFGFFQIKHEKEMYKLKHLLFSIFQYLNSVSINPLIYRICLIKDVLGLTVYLIKTCICKTNFRYKHMLMTCMGVELPRISTIPKLKKIKFLHGFAVLCYFWKSILIYLVYYNTTLYVDLWI